MKAKSQLSIQPDWWSKTFAGLFLGLSFACILGAIILLIGREILEPNLAPQFSMWAIPWIWCPIFFLAYFIPKGWQAIVLYSIANVIAYSILLMLRS